MHNNLFIIPSWKYSCIAWIKTEAEDVAIVFPLHDAWTVAPRQGTINIPQQNSSVIPSWKKNIKNYKKQKKKNIALV